MSFETSFVPPYAPCWPFNKPLELKFDMSTGKNKLSTAEKVKMEAEIETSRHRISPSLELALQTKLKVAIRHKPAKLDPRLVAAIKYQDTSLL